MQLYVVDGRARDPCGPPPARAALLTRANATLSDLARTGQSGRCHPDLVKLLAKEQPDRQVARTRKGL